MKIEMEPGTYVVAVSGGVDSMVLLNMLSKIPKLKLVVAHFDHGIRTDSEQDRHLVQAAAKKYRLPFVFDEGRLGPGASEAAAREVRYKFLQKTAQASNANAIITAHHQDDMLETAIINMMRGTGRRGLTSLRDLPNLKRPLLSYTKAEIISYAKQHNLEWREDSTNQDKTYLRNYVRHEIIPKLTAGQKANLLKHIDKLGELNQEIDTIIDGLVGRQSELDRQWFISLDHKVALDVMASWLRAHSINDFDSKRLELLVRAAKTYQPDKQIDIDKTHQLQVKKDLLAL
jgi:tRNA(Ile)-lysidine synthetase-like protein